MMRTRKAPKTKPALKLVWIPLACAAVCAALSHRLKTQLPAVISSVDRAPVEEVYNFTLGMLCQDPSTSDACPTIQSLDSMSLIALFFVCLFGAYTYYATKPKKTRRGKKPAVPFHSTIIVVQFALIAFSVIYCYAGFSFLR